MVILLFFAKVTFLPNTFYFYLSNLFIVYLYFYLSNLFIVYLYFYLSNFLQYLQH